MIRSCLTLALLAIALTVGAESVMLTPSPASRVRVEGDSSLHPWFTQTSSFTAMLTVDADAATVQLTFRAHVALRNGPHDVSAVVIT